MTDSTTVQQKSITCMSYHTYLMLACDKFRNFINFVSLTVASGCLIMNSIKYFFMNIQFTQKIVFMTAAIIPWRKSPDLTTKWLYVYLPVGMLSFAGAWSLQTASGRTGLVRVQRGITLNCSHVPKHDFLIPNPTVPLFTGMFNRDLDMDK